MFSNGLLHMDMQVLDNQLRTYQQQLCMFTGCNLEDLPKAMNDIDEWWESGKSMLAEQHVDDNIYDIFIYLNHFRMKLSNMTVKAV